MIHIRKHGSSSLGIPYANPDIVDTGNLVRRWLAQLLPAAYYQFPVVHSGMAEVPSGMDGLG